MALINIDYKDTMNKAEQLEAKAKELRKLANRNLESIQSTSRKNWTGSASKLYEKRLNTFSRQMLSQANTLERLAKELYAASRFYHTIETSAEQIFGGGR